MTEEELLNLCSDENIQNFKGNVPYWTSEMYGFGRYIREYGHYPDELPLIIFTEHSGPVVMDKFNYFETNHDAPTVMLHSPERVKKWREQFEKPCHILYSPFAFYRRKNRIQQAKHAKGTLAYPAHTIPQFDIVSDMEQYITQLKNLPEKYQPVSVSLHYHDINKGLHKLFFRHGIPVYTAGNPMDYRFTERFYSILKSFKYTTSNFLGSFIFYAVEMNIPFFLLGSRPEFRSNTDSKLAEVALDVANTKDAQIDYLTKMFTIRSDKVTSEQRDLVESTLGLHDGVGRFKMAQILYINYSRFYLKKKIIRLRKVMERLKRRLVGMKRKIQDIVKL